MLLKYHGISGSPGLSCQYPGYYCQVSSYWLPMLLLLYWYSLSWNSSHLSRCPSSSPSFLIYLDFSLMRRQGCQSCRSLSRMVGSGTDCWSADLSDLACEAVQRSTLWSMALNMDLLLLLALEFLAHSSSCLVTIETISPGLPLLQLSLDLPTVAHLLWSCLQSCSSFWHSWAPVHLPSMVFCPWLSVVPALTSLSSSLRQLVSFSNIFLEILAKIINWLINWLIEIKALI